MRLYLTLQLLLLNLCYAWRDVIVPHEEPTSTTETPKPWYRTIYSTQVEIVTPTVVAGVTFSAKPAATENPLKPWITLNDEGLPKTIIPEIKNGHTRKASPDYSTYFMRIYTKTLSHEELQAYNMDPNEVHEEEVVEEEDKTYVSLNPVIRCTPDRYYNKGPAKNIKSEPFCTPKEHKDWKVDTTYFATWYTRFFKNADGSTVDKVRVHLSYVQQSKKRDIPATFFSSEWIKNVDGIYPVSVDSKWLEGDFMRKVVLSVQPKNVPDDEFNPLEHGVVLNILRNARVFKGNDRKTLEDSGIDDDSWYYIVLAIPTVVVFAIAIMYIFVQLNGNHRDFSDVKHMAMSQRHKVLGKFKNMKRFKNMKNHKYDELPRHSKKTSKQS
ncbi:HDR146Cp [Eremothecium sinecaudum]|uniref:HDR146Cp n=1 Tax=Eremothecium sinecaudum TaxID=45286 RepID=A0A0X8HT26_9SACH|nr:HDR146Cp [Eremothecium sinecaudum]AMD20888.1 HDR146Cp [Eremothecium sinecaudum]